MTFWLDRFRRDDEEDIWEELRQMILNPPSEEEIALKKQEEQAQINAILDRVFPDIEKPAKEPYLTREEFFGLDGEPQNGTSPVLEGKVIKEYPRDPYKEIDEKESWSDELKAQKKAEIDKSIKKYKDKEKEINREHLLEQAKNYGGAALEIGSAFVPGYGGVKLAGTLASKVAPKVGRKIAQELATGTLKGASSGTMEGFGRGLMEDKNPLVTAAQDTLTGAALGGAGGAVGGNVEKAIRKQVLRKYDKLLKNKEITKQEKKDFIKSSNKYYQDYEQGVVTNIEGLGNVKLSSEGLKETIRQKPEHIVDVIDLSKNLKKSKILETEPPKHSHKYNINKFHHLRGNNVDYQIAENQKGDKYFYKITDPYLTGPKPEGESLLSTPKSPNNIISAFNTNLNPQVSNQTLQPPKSHNQWLEDLKRKRKKRWF